MVKLFINMVLDYEKPYGGVSCGLLGLFGGVLGSFLGS